MKVALNRQKELILTDKIIIQIGESKYKLTETVDGKLNINKTNFDDEELRVFPRYGNEIDIL